jgi:hypothetical protein
VGISRPRSWDQMLDTPGVMVVARRWKRAPSAGRKSWRGEPTWARTASRKLICGSSGELTTIKTVRRHLLEIEEFAKEYAVKVHTVHRVRR